MKRRVWLPIVPFVLAGIEWADRVELRDEALSWREEHVRLL